MSLNDIYHIAMIAIGLYGLVLSTVLGVWTIYTGVRRLKKTSTNGVEKKAKTSKKTKKYNKK